MFAQYPYDPIWLSCYVSITITHIALKSGPSNEASVSIANTD